MCNDCLLITDRLRRCIRRRVYIQIKRPSYTPLSLAMRNERSLALLFHACAPHRLNLILSLAVCGKSVTRSLPIVFLVTYLGAVLETPP